MLDMSELTDWQEYAKIFAGLFAMVDPIGNTPVYLSLTAEADAQQRRRIARIGVLTMLATLVLFEIAGEAILDLFSVDLGAFQIAGGIVLIVTAFELIRGTGSEAAPTESHLMGVVPLGIPLLAGPAGISAVIVFSHQEPGVSLDVVVIVVIAATAAVSWLVLRAAPAIERRLSAVALAAFTRIMGLIVAAIGVEFVVHGLEAHFPGWL